MDVHERRQMILARQRLTVPGPPLEVCGGLNGLQAQFPGYARHALALRCGGLREDWSAGLGRTWTIRGTMHMVPLEDLSLFLHRDRAHHLREVDRFVDDPWVPAARKRELAACILACIDRGTVEREALRTACRGEGMTEAEERSVFDGWGGLFRAMAEEGLICCEAGEGRRFRRCPAFVPMDREAAELEQARRYFTAFGPASVRDAAYFFGVPQRMVRRWLDRLPVETVCCGERECFLIGSGPGDLPEVPEAVLLAGFDQLMLGYEKRESIFLPPEYLRGIFNRAGIVLPCLLLDGQAAGRWRRSGRRVDLMAFRTLRARERRAAEREVLRWFPETREILWMDS